MRFASILLIRVIMVLVPVLVLSAQAHSVELDGLIEPHMVVNVGSGVAGIIEKVSVDRGDFVKRGQVLATLQSGVEEAAMELARARAKLTASIELGRARLEFAKREEVRADDLHPAPAASQPVPSRCD